MSQPSHRTAVVQVLHKLLGSVVRLMDAAREEAALITLAANGIGAEVACQLNEKG